MGWMSGIGSILGGLGGLFKKKRKSKTYGGAELTPEGQSLYGQIESLLGQYMPGGPGKMDIPEFDVEDIMKGYPSDEMGRKFQESMGSQFAGTRRRMEDIAGRRGESGLLYSLLPQMEYEQAGRTAEGLRDIGIERGRLETGLRAEKGRMGAERRMGLYDMLLQLALAKPDLVRRYQEGSQKG